MLEYGEKSGLRLKPLAAAAIKLAIFASGGGSNAAQIINYFKRHPTIQIKLVVTNKPKAGVLQIAAAANIPTLLLERETFCTGDGYTSLLEDNGIQFIVLAGFLWKVPPALIKAFRGNIINIHPALLPKFGGQGMYGRYVHEAVLQAGEKESGITVHYADEYYDHGAVIFQATCPVLANDTAITLAQRVLDLEHKHYARVIETVVEQKAFV